MHRGTAVPVDRDQFRPTCSCGWVLERQADGSPWTETAAVTVAWQHADESNGLERATRERVEQARRRCELGEQAAQERDERVRLLRPREEPAGWELNLDDAQRLRRLEEQRRARLQRGRNDLETNPGH